MDNVVNGWVDAQATITNVMNLAQITGIAVQTCKKENEGPRLLENYIQIKITPTNESKDDVSIAPTNTTLNAHIIKCVQDIESLIPDMRALYTDLETHVPVESAIKDGVLFLQTVASAVVDCGVTLSLADQDILKNATKCIEEIEILEPSLAVIAQEIETNNYTSVEIIEQLTNLYSEYGKAFMEDCGLEYFVTKYINSNCGQELLIALQNAIIYLNSANNTDDIRIIVTKMMDQLEYAIKDCKKDLETFII